MAQKQVRHGRARSDEELAKDRERKRIKRARDKRNRELVKVMGLTDEDGKLLEPGKKKSAMQRANEARLELQQQVLDLYAAGMSPDDIAISLDLHLGQTKRLIEQGLAQLAQHHARATPADNFARYAYFHMRTIQRLDDLVQQFLDDPESKQYNATVTALRARSDLLDKVYRMGNKLGIMNLTKAQPEAGMSGADLVAALMRERQQLDAVIAELKISVTEKTVTAAVKRAPKTKALQAAQDVTALQVQDPASNGGNGTRDLLEAEVGDELATEIIKERTKDREPGTA